MFVSGLIRKIKSKKGESLAETLASIVIVAMMMTMIAGGVVAAARMNSRADNKKYTLHVSDAQKVTSPTMTFTVTSAAGNTGADAANYMGTTGAATSEQAGVSLYHDEKGDYYFFE